MAKTDLTTQQARELFHYDPETGVLWRKLTSLSRQVTSLSAGYVQARVRGNTYRAHRIIWLWLYGAWPSLHIDHVNGTRSDNRLANLREVTRSTNLQNLRDAHTDNQSGYLGVVHTSGRANPWRAEIFYRGKNHYLGRYATPEEAHDAYLEAKRRLHEGCTI